VNVLRLVRKDLRLQRSFMAAIGLCGMVSAAIFFAQLDRAPAAAYVSVVHLLSLVGGFTIAFRTVVAEEKNKAFFFLKTLPLSGVEIVAAKFLTNTVLVTSNYLLLMAFYTLLVASGRLAGAPAPTATAVWIGCTVQWFSSAIFLATALVFDSEKAIWVPFPLIWVAITIAANIRQIIAALRLEGVVRVIGEHHALVGALLFAATAALMCATTAAFERKRTFG